ncbi:hypothetical protein BJX76DRAFT_315152 [Aspergillus varians]
MRYPRGDTKVLITNPSLHPPAPHESTAQPNPILRNQRVIPPLPPFTVGSSEQGS